MNDIFQVVEQQHQLLVLAVATLVVRQVVEVGAVDVVRQVVEVGAVDVVRQVVEVVFTSTLMPLQLLVVPPTVRTVFAPRPLTFLVGRAAEDARNAHKRYPLYRKF